MKTFLIILLAIALLAIIAFAAVVLMTSDISKTADHFFTEVKSENYDKAYLLVSEDFKNQTSKEQLKAYIKSKGLNTLTDISWSSRSIRGNTGKLTGSASTQVARAIPISLGFIKGKGGWKISSLTNSSSGIQENIIGQKPSEREQIKLVSDSMYVFAASAKEKSMAKMFNHVSYLWQNQFSVSQFDEIFGSFFRNGDSLVAVVKELTPQFTEEAVINEKGILVLKGIYPSKPYALSFEQDYVYEGLGWKLIRFKVSVE